MAKWPLRLEEAEEMTENRESYKINTWPESWKKAEANQYAAGCNTMQ